MDPAPSPAQARWMDLRYGIFIHFGPNTYSGADWGDGDFDPVRFCPDRLDTDQWAEVIAAAGARYAVLTAKHHDGFCLWPSARTTYSVAASPGGIDMVGAFADSCRAAGIRVGLYYSLWDRHEPCYHDDEAYHGFIRDQLSELLTGYGAIDELWFDGGWDKDHPSREWPFDPAWATSEDGERLRGARWGWRALVAHIKALQADCLVANNSSSDRPGGVKAWPIDLRTAEHLDFVIDDETVPVSVDPVIRTPDGGRSYLPLEYCTTLNPGWFWKPHYSHPSPEAIAAWLARARRDGANLLLNVGPNRDGLIPAIHREQLVTARVLAEADGSLARPAEASP